MRLTGVWGVLADDKLHHFPGDSVVMLPKKALCGLERTAGLPVLVTTMPEEHASAVARHSICGECRKLREAEIREERKRYALL